MQDLFTKFLLSFFLAFALCALLMPAFIAFARKKATQPIYEDAPARHQQKAKTPTMGGVVFVLCAVVAAAVIAPLDAAFMLAAAVLAGFCAIGMIDDLKKILGASNHAGLSARAKMLALVLLSAAVGYGALHFGAASGDIRLPFAGDFAMGRWAILFWILVMISAANAVNLTDGLDGLAAGCGVFSIASFMAILGAAGYAAAEGAQASGAILRCGCESVLILAISLIGALVAFLCFNAHPAKVFMGDSGSLALGGFLGFLAIIARAELLLIIIGIVYVIETASVIIQVFSFRVFGRRVFKMSPLHHHFEQIGWAENHITQRFCVLSLLAGVVGFWLGVK